MNIGLWGFPAAGVAFSLAGVLLPGRLRRPSPIASARTGPAPSRPRSLSEYRVLRRGVDAPLASEASAEPNAADVVPERELVHEPDVTRDSAVPESAQAAGPHVAIATQLRAIYLRFAHRSLHRAPETIEELLEDGVVGEVEVLPARAEAAVAAPAPDLTQIYVAPVVSTATHLEPPQIVPMTSEVVPMPPPAIVHEAVVPEPTFVKAIAPRRRIGWFGRPSRPAIILDETVLEATSTPPDSGIVRTEMSESVTAEATADPAPPSPFVLGMAWQGAPAAVEEDDVLIDAEAIARADARLAEFAETTMVPERPVAVMIPAWVSEYEEAGVDVSEAGRVALAERLGLLEDEDAITELRRVLMTETASVVRGVALLTIGERIFVPMTDVVVSAMETGDAYERCAAITALAALGDVNALRAALGDEDDGVVRMAVTLLLETRDADEVRAMIAERGGTHSEVALATVDSLI